MTQVPPPVSAPVCYRHTSRETYIRCTRCDRPICPDCMNEASVGHQCPECVTEGRKTQRPVRTAFGAHVRRRTRLRDDQSHRRSTARSWCCPPQSSTNFAKALIGADAGGLFGAGTPLSQRFAVFAGGDFRFSDGSVRARPGIADGEYYRLFTAMFMHYGLLHLLFNMWALWIIGRSLEAHARPGPIPGRLPDLRPRRQRRVLPVLRAVSRTAPAPRPRSSGCSPFSSSSCENSAETRQQLMPLLVINLAFTFFVPGISRAGHIGGLITGASWSVTC